MVSSRLSTYVSRVISNEVNNRVVDSQLLLPSLGGERIIDSDDVDALDALGGELVGLLAVARDLRRAWWGEGARNTDEDV